MGAIATRPLVPSNPVRFQGNTVTIPGLGTVVTAPPATTSGPNNQANPASILNMAAQQKVVTSANQQATSILNNRNLNNSAAVNVALKSPTITPTKMTKAEAARQAKLAKTGLTPTKNTPVAIAPSTVVKTEPPPSTPASTRTLSSPPSSPQQQFVLTPAITQQSMKLYNTCILDSNY